MHLFLETVKIIAFTRIMLCTVRFFMMKNPGVKLTMETDYPCFVCYSGNQLPKKYNAVCLEAQLLPDAVNHRGFGSTVLKPNKEYRHFVSYQFGIDLIDNI